MAALRIWYKGSHLFLYQIVIGDATIGTVILYLRSMFIALSQRPFYKRILCFKLLNCVFLYFKYLPLVGANFVCIKYQLLLLSYSTEIGVHVFLSQLQLTFTVTCISLFHRHLVAILLNKSIFYLFYFKGFMLTKTAYVSTLLVLNVFDSCIMFR